MQRLGPFPVEPVEAPHLVRAVLRTESSPDAAIVNLIVKPLFGMVGRVHRAHRFAGCVVAVLAQHGQKYCFFHSLGILITLYVQPRHFAAFNDPLHSHNSEIVFGIAGGRTGRAANTSVEIDHHAPPILLVIMGGIEIPFGIVAFRQGQG